MTKKHSRGNRPLVSLLALFSLSILCLGFTGCQANSEHVRAFQRALDKFDQAKTPEDYLQCAAIYQQIIDEGTTSGAVLFNQGNAFAKAKQKGRALACYRQALRYRPNDKNIEASLRNTTSTNSDNKTILEYLCFWQNWISYPAKYQIGFGLLLITLALSTMQIRMSVAWLRNAGIVAAVLTGLAIVSVGYDWFRFDYTKHGVTVESVVGRKGNSSTYEPAFQAPLDETTEFTVEEIRNDWALIRLADGKTAWLPLKSIVIY